MINDTVIPSHIQIETVAGKCTLSCLMCPIKHSKRKEIMNNDVFTKILNKLQPYLNHQKLLSFCGLGETLLDKYINKKVNIAKELGFRGVGIYTNGTLLNYKLSQKLLDSNLDTLIISIDGFTSETQKAIRIGSNLDQIILNVEQFIALRESNKSKTKIIIRFTKQELNKHEENGFYNFWKSRINSSYNDSISIYNVHNFGRHVLDFKKELDDDLLNKIGKLKCPEIYERLMIGSDGSVSLCCGDQFGHYDIGNILEEDLMKLYNSENFIYYRELMSKGRILDLELCKNCLVVYSIATRNINK